LSVVPCLATVSKKDVFFVLTGASDLITGATARR
jgi:hypothetical protein